MTNELNADTGPWGYDGPLHDYLPDGRPRSKSSSELAREMRRAAFADPGATTGDSEDDYS
jgi:hypothetical protein